MTEKEESQVEILEEKEPEVVEVPSEEETCKDCDPETCDCPDASVEQHEDKPKKGKFFQKKEDASREIITELKATIDDLEQKSLRDKAELINYRKRKDEEVSRMMKYCNENIVKELLGVTDNFERAIAMDDTNLEDEVSKFLSGFKMIYCNLDQILIKYGVAEIPAKDQEFDPSMHQAVLTEHVDGTPPGIIIEVMQKGYTLKDKVIRPSMVKVSE